MVHYTAHVHTQYKPISHISPDEVYKPETGLSLDWILLQFHMYDICFLKGLALTSREIHDETLSL